MSLRKYWPVLAAEPCTSSHTLPLASMAGPELPDTRPGAVATWDSLPLDETDSKQTLEPQEAVSITRP